MAQFGVISTLRQTTDIELRFGEGRFKMRIQPLGPREGSRGVFVFRERYEPLLTFGSRFLKPGDVAFDLGANQGIFCCAFGSVVGETGRVVAVEPIPRQVERLRRNVELNGFVQCEVVQKAIAERAGTAVLGIANGDTAASIVATDTSVSITVDVASVDELVEQFGLMRVDFIKLDVEGAELMALKGAEGTLRRFLPGLSIEASSTGRFQPIRDYLEGLGYEFYVFDAKGRLEPMIRLEKLEDNVIALAKGAATSGRTLN
jgi:FkbM family methyltransferase